MRRWDFLLMILFAFLLLIVTKLLKLQGFMILGMFLIGLVLFFRFRMRGKKSR